jgi:hypothetical protein
MLKRACHLVVLTCLLGGVAWAASDPLVGDWKLNPQKSKLTDVMKVENLGGNKYSFDFGGGDPEIAVADGTDQRGISGSRSLSAWARRISGRWCARKTGRCW